jgi:hypothetical protein
MNIRPEAGPQSRIEASPPQTQTQTPVLLARNNDTMQPQARRERPESARKPAAAAAAATGGGGGGAGSNTNAGQLQRNDPGRPAAEAGPNHTGQMQRNEAGAGLNKGAAGGAKRGEGGANKSEGGASKADVGVKKGEGVPDSGGDAAKKLDGEGKAARPVGVYRPRGMRDKDDK